MRLELFIIERSKLGEGDEFVFLPICDHCLEPIYDMEQANLVAMSHDFWEGESKPKDTGEVIDGARLLRSRLPMRALHHDCDKGHMVPWKRMSKVIRMDQRDFVSTDQS